MLISDSSSGVCSSSLGLYNLDVTHALADYAGLLEHLDIDFVDRQTLQIGQANLRIQLLARRRKAALGQAALHRHLAAFEADFVEAARAGFLAIVAPSGDRTGVG